MDLVRFEDVDLAKLSPETVIVLLLGQVNEAADNWNKYSEKVKILRDYAEVLGQDTQHLKHLSQIERSVLDDLRSIFIGDDRWELLGEEAIQLWESTFFPAIQKAFASAAFKLSLYSLAKARIVNLRAPEFEPKECVQEAINEVNAILSRFGTKIRFEVGENGRVDRKIMEG